MSTFEVRSLDMWGHISADCAYHGCPCIDDDCECQCIEECNQSYWCGEIEICDDTDILQALVDAGYLTNTDGVAHDMANGYIEITDREGRRIFDLVTDE